MSAKKIFLMLAPGFEEIEALATADTLRRLSLNVTLVGLNDGPVSGSHGISVNPDSTLSRARFEDAHAIVLPGGMPGSLNLRNCGRLIGEIKQAAAEGKIIAAICAAPIILERAGLTQGHRVTGYPGSEHDIPGLFYTGADVEVDGTIITARGPGLSIPFAAAVASALGKSELDIKTLFAGMFVKP